MKYSLGRLAAVSVAMVLLVAVFATSAFAQTIGPGGMMGPGSSGTGPGNMGSGSSSGYQFMMGFGVMGRMMGDVAGQPVQDEWHGANGDALQMTTTGMMAWRKADNWTAFTNGYMTWVNGPSGMQMRLNSDRFPWEAQ